MKKCTKCGVEKPLTEFHKKKAGHRPRCKACRREYRSQNKEKANQYAAEYRAQNKEKIAEYRADRKSKQPGCVYQISNSISNIFYIGQTTRGELRWKEHLKRLRGNYHRNHKLQQDFNEHGEDAFEWSVIKELPKDPDQLLLQEAIEIQERINNGEDLYNLMLTIEQLKMLKENKEKRQW